MKWAMFCAALAGASCALASAPTREGPIGQAAAAVDELRRGGVAMAYAIYPAPRDKTVPEGFFVEPSRKRRAPGCNLNVSATDSLLNLVRNTPTTHAAHVQAGGKIVVYLTTRSKVPHEITFVSDTSEALAASTRVMVVVDGEPRFSSVHVVNRFVRKLRVSGCAGVEFF